MVIQTIPALLLKKKIKQYRNVLGKKVRMACHPDITTACFFPGSFFLCRCWWFCCGFFFFFFFGPLTTPVIRDQTHVPCSGSSES